MPKARSSFTGFETSQFTAGSAQPVSDTGYDFADFLLGLPQQTTLQSGTNSYNFRANSFDLFAQDDWRILLETFVQSRLPLRIQRPLYRS